MGDWWGKALSGRGDVEPGSLAVTPRYDVHVDIRGERRAIGLSQSQLARAAGIPQPNLSAYENGRRVPSAEVLDRIRRALAVRPSARVEQHRESILALVAKHHAVSPRVFGSVARGDDEAGSDLDLLVDFTDEASLLDEIGLRLALTDLLQVDVDVVAADTLKGRVSERVLREAVEVSPSRATKRGTRPNASSPSATSSQA